MDQHNESMVEQWKQDFLSITGFDRVFVQKFAKECTGSDHPQKKEYNKINCFSNYYNKVFNSEGGKLLFMGGGRHAVHSGLRTD